MAQRPFAPARNVLLLLMLPVDERGALHAFFFLVVSLLLFSRPISEPSCSRSWPPAFCVLPVFLLLSVGELLDKEALRAIGAHDGGEFC
jgi:hypothetical protein